MHALGAMSGVINSIFMNNQDLCITFLTAYHYIFKLTHRLMKQSSKPMLHFLQELVVFDVLGIPDWQTVFQMWPVQTLVQLHHQTRVPVLDGLLD